MTYIHHSDENRPPEEDTGEGTIREKAAQEGDVAGTMESVRQETKEEGGAMGRKETPREDPPQGQWHHKSTEDTNPH